MLGAGDELLRRLGSGVRPDGVRARSPRGAIDGLGFGALLDASTRVGGGAPIAVDEGLGIEFSEEMRDRLGRVADRAVAMGLGRIVAVVDGGVVELDAGRRAVVCALGDSGDEPLVGVDGLAVLTGEGVPDRLFGVGLHGPRPSERAAGADGTGWADRASDRGPQSGASIALSGSDGGGVSGTLLALLAEMESGRCRSGGGAEDQSGNESV